MTSQRLTSQDVLLLLEGDISDVEFPFEDSDEEGDLAVLPPTQRLLIENELDQSVSTCSRSVSTVVFESDSEEENFTTQYVATTSAVTRTDTTRVTTNDSDEESATPLSVRLSRIVPPNKPATQPLRWRKHDIDTPDTTCTTNFTRPNGDLTSLQYFKLFFTNEIVQHLTLQTNLYSVQQTGTSIGVTEAEIEQFIGIHIMSGIIKVPSYRSYWADSTRFPLIADVMSRNRFSKIRSFFHVNDNSDMLARDDPNYDKLFKVRPFVEALRKNFGKIECEEYNAVDEIIIPFKGHSSLKQYIRNKPHKWGIKMFARAGASGIMYDFEVYVGKGTVSSESGLGISGDIVLRLSEGLPSNANFKVFTDNWFTSHKLIVALKERGIWSVGTVRPNRLPGCTLASDAELKKKGRGSYDFCTEQTTGVLAIKWYDNKAVHLASSYASVNPTEEVKRWSVSDKRKIDVTIPRTVCEYNKYMGGVDLHNMLVELYRTDIRVKRFYLRIIFHLIDTCVVNAWLLYRRHRSLDGEKRYKPLVDFRSEIAQGLLLAGKTTDRKRGRRSQDVTPPPRKRRVPGPIEDVRFDGVSHWPIHIEPKQRCKLCVKAKSRVKCNKCNVALCLNKDKNCFLLFHKK